MQKVKETYIVDDKFGAPNIHLGHPLESDSSTLTMKKVHKTEDEELHIEAENEETGEWKIFTTSDLLWKCPEKRYDKIMEYLNNHLE